MCSAYIYFFGTSLLNKLGCAAQRASCCNYIIAHKNISSCNVSNYLLCLYFRTTFSLFVHNRQFTTQMRGIFGGRFHITNIRRNYCKLIDLLIPKIFTQYQLTCQMINRDIEKSLKLCSVQVYCYNSIGTCRSNDICYKFSGNRYSPFVFSILSCITKIRNNRSDTLGTGPSQAIQINQKFHQMLVNGFAG